MKKLVFKIFVLSILIFSPKLNAQILIGDAYKNDNPIIKESFDLVSYSQNFSFLGLETLKTEKGVFYKIDMGEDFVISQKVGSPELPIYSQLIELPYGGDVEIEYSNIITETFSLGKYGDYRLVPLQKSLSKSETENPFIIDEGVYSRDEFFGNDLVVVEKLGYMGGVRLARLAVSPIRYNPITNTIIVVRSFDVNIRFLNFDIKKTQDAKLRYNNQQSAFLGQRTINGKAISASAIPSAINRPLKMIILSDPMFSDLLQPFIRWKKEKGIEIVEVYKGDVGVGTTKQEMKAYLKSLWDNATADSPAADYLLICGDIQQIPAFSLTTDQYGSAPTDLYYAEYTGDFLPDLFYGRFSAQTLSQMEAIINKTIIYEKNQMLDNAYLRKTLLVAGRETNSPAPTCGNGQVNYAKSYLINNPNTDTLVYYNPSSSSYASQIRDSIAKNGYSYINYTAHCDEGGWSIPSLTPNHIRSMDSDGMLSFYINNCCLSNKFNESECFGEAILRADNKGGVGAIGGSSYTYWYEDFYWSVGNKSINTNPSYSPNNLGSYDRLFHQNNEVYSKWYTTAGQILQAGNLAVQQSGSNLSNYYWEVYHLMGDPSLSPYIGLPNVITSIYPDSIPLGYSNIPIETQPFAFVSISQNGELLGASQADSNGDINIVFHSPVNSQDNLMIVITNQFSFPVIDSIGVFVPSYPIININSLKYYNDDLEEVSDLKNNKEYFIGFDIANLGTSSIDNVLLKVSNTPNLIFSDSIEYIGFIGGSEDLGLEKALKVKIIDGTINRSQLEYSINIIGEDNYNDNKVFSIDAYSPELEIENIVITTDTINDLLHGERIFISFDIRNIGRNISDFGSIDLSPLSSNLYSEFDNLYDLSPLSPNASSSYSFALIFDPSLGNSDYINFKISAIAGQYYNTRIYDSISLDGNIETFETGDITYFPWVNDDLKPWTIEAVSSKVYEGRYSLRSGNISDNQKTVLGITMSSISNDSMSFYLKTSTEASYDIFRFYIDELLVLEKSGEKDWQRYAFAIGNGEHNYRWEYEKDYSRLSGSDAVWLDNIKFPPNASIISINSIEEDLERVNIYPNPAQDIINISNLRTKSDIILYDVLGRVKYLSSNNIISNINVSNLESGIYYLSIKSNNSVVTKKIIIAR